jgi:hypothetical protein
MIVEVPNDNPRPIDNPHNGKLIEKIVVSLNEEYLVTYSQEDRSIVGWNANAKEEGKLIPDYTVELSDIIEEFLNLNQICVSNDKKLACIYNDRKFLSK